MMPIKQFVLDFPDLTNKEHAAFWRRRFLKSKPVQKLFADMTEEDFRRNLSNIVLNSSFDFSPVFSSLRQLTEQAQDLYLALFVQYVRDYHWYVYCLLITQALEGRLWSDSISEFQVATLSAIHDNNMKWVLEGLGHVRDQTNQLIQDVVSQALMPAPRCRLTILPKSMG